MSVWRDSGFEGLFKVWRYSLKLKLCPIVKGGRFGFSKGRFREIFDLREDFSTKRMAGRVESISRKLVPSAESMFRGSMKLPDIPVIDAIS